MWNLAKLFNYPRGKRTFKPNDGMKYKYMVFTTHMITCKSFKIKSMHVRYIMPSC